MGFGSFLSSAFDVVKDIAVPAAAASTGNPWLLAASKGLDLIGDNLGPAISGYASYQGQSSANAANAEIAAAQMAFQERMSNTAHQRQVTDLVNAGLNPILSANSGASSPSGASAVMQNALGAGVSSALEAKRVKATVDQTAQAVENMKQENRNLRSQDEKIRSDTALNHISGRLAEAQIVKAKQDAILSASSARQADANAKYVSAGIPNRRVENAVSDVLLPGIEHLSSSAKSLSEGAGRFAKDAFGSVVKHVKPYFD